MPGLNGAHFVLQCHGMPYISLSSEGLLPPKPDFAKALASGLRHG
ncbi:hypothetical protein A11S_1362 [Micavibrio aeruginosavorus EPB]|uniref:Uncharacterized protein n=1 Tax=Micavibrio aeruginosavorus EPB TaxID=349215 RepID=M4VJE0_9BACT|nr:hypothetical protein A11S_1362 [Micavibrio aeruginosavorus EPB]